MHLLLFPILTLPVYKAFMGGEKYEEYRTGSAWYVEEDGEEEEKKEDGDDEEKHDEEEDEEDEEG